MNVELLKTLFQRNLFHKPPIQTLRIFPNPIHSQFDKWTSTLQMRYKLFHAALRSISFSGIIFLTMLIHSLQKKVDSELRGFSLLCDSNKQPQTQIESTTFINYTLHTLRHSTLIIHISRQSKEIAIWSILSFIYFIHSLLDLQHSNQSI